MKQRSHVHCLLGVQSHAASAGQPQGQRADHGLRGRIAPICRRPRNVRTSELGREPQILKYANPLGLPGRPRGSILRGSLFRAVDPSDPQICNSAVYPLAPSRRYLCRIRGVLSLRSLVTCRANVCSPFLHHSAPSRIDSAAEPATQLAGP